MKNINVKIEKTVTVKLELSEKAAQWLKGLVQNPFMENESDIDKHMREAFWEALDGVDPL